MLSDIIYIIYSTTLAIQNRERSSQMSLSFLIWSKSVVNPWLAWVVLIVYSKVRLFCVCLLNK